MHPTKWIALIVLTLLTACRDSPAPPVAQVTASVSTAPPPPPPTLPASAAAVQLLAGDGTAATLADPYGLAYAADGNVLVADSFNDRIRRIRRIAPDGRVSTVAGGAQPDWKDSPGEAARLDTPLWASPPMARAICGSPTPATTRCAS